MPRKNHPSNRRQSSKRSIDQTRVNKPRVIRTYRYQ